MNDARMESFRLQWSEERRPFYEVYFIKGNLLDARRAFWLRYTLSAPTAGGVLAQLWGIVFDAGRPERNFAVRKDLYQPLDWRPGGELIIGPAQLTLHSASGVIDDRERGHRLSWQLEFASPLGALRHFPNEAWYRLPIPRTKLASPWWQGRLSGWLEADGERWEFLDAPGQLEHLWGSEHAWRWAWGHANAFLEDREAVWEGLDAQIRLGPLTSPHLKVFFLHAFGKSYVFNSLSRWLTNRSRWRPGGWSWEFAACGAGISLEGRAQVDPLQVVGVTYTDPGGDRLWCHNTKLARLELRLSEGGRLKGELHCPEAAAVEFVDRRIYPGVRVML